MSKTNVEFTDIACFLLFCGETFEGFEETRKIFFFTFTRLLFLKNIFQMTHNFPPEAFSSDKWSSHVEFQEKMFIEKFRHN